MKLSITSKAALLIQLFSITVLSRLIPHPASFIPLASIILLGYTRLSRSQAFLALSLAMLVSNMLLNHRYHAPLFGPWDGFMLGSIILIGLLPFRTLTIASCLWASVYYWFWTNLGCWWQSGMYAHSIHGLIECYEMALPFLKNAIIANLMFAIVFCVLAHKLKHNYDSKKIPPLHS